MSKPAFVLFVLSLLTSSPAAADNLSGISFELHADGDSAELALQYSRRGSTSNHSSAYPWRDLRGIDAGALNGRTHPASFTLTRDAGRLSCEGQAQNGRASGFCDFEGSETFADGLERRGVRGAEGVHLLHLALCDFDLTTLDEFERLGYPRPSLDEVMAMAVHGVDGEYARGMAEAGYKPGDANDLVALRIHGVTPAYVRDIAANGPAWRSLPASELLALTIHGVTPEFARGMAALGYRGEAPSQLVAMRIHGVDPQYVRALRQLGYGDMSSDNLIAARVHGVTPEFAREMREAGYSDLSMEELIAMRVHGLDSRYARATRRHNRN